MALEIYQGKVKGLKGVPDEDSIRGGAMRGLIKMKIHEQLEATILDWRRQASVDLRSGKPRDTV